MRHETRLRGSLALVSIMALASACVSIGPVGSGAVPTSVATIPGATALATAQTTIAPPTSPPITAPPATPTAAPTPTPTVAPTATPTDVPTATPTIAPTATPTDAPTATPAERLNFSLDPNYGLVELESGYVPDPHSKEMVAGGSVDASYLGDECRGFATSAPDYSVRYTAGDRSLLRFYFLANIEGEDATMIINDPQGQWLCSDDWNTTTRNPGIDATDPQTGRYDIWVGSFAAGTTVLGTLQVTELESNHP